MRVIPGKCHVRALTVAAVAAVAIAPAQASPDKWLVLTDVTLVDGTGGAARAVARLVTRNGLIVGIDSGPVAAAPLDQVTQISVDGAFVIPGLVDAHVHLTGYPGDRETMDRRMANALRGGITSVRDLAGDARVLADTRRAILRGEFAGLSIAYAALFGGASMFDDPRLAEESIGYDPGTAAWLQKITADTDVPLAVARARGAGVDGIKLYGNLDAMQVAAIGAEARRQDLRVWAHATVFPATPGDLLDAGVEVLSHAPYLIWEAVDTVPDDYGARREGPYKKISPRHRKIRALLRRMAASHTFLDSTLLVYRDVIALAEGPDKGAWAREAFEWGTQVVRLAHELGVPIAAGTDRFTADDWSLPDLHEEMVILVHDCGLSPMDALVAATRNASRAAGFANRGTIEPGMAADLVILGSNPLVDIQATRDIRIVIKDGQVVHSDPGH